LLQFKLRGVLDMLCTGSRRIRQSSGTGGVTRRGEVFSTCRSRARAKRFFTSSPGLDLLAGQDERNKDHNSPTRATPSPPKAMSVMVAMMCCPATRGGRRRNGVGHGGEVRKP
jgi:hypothetical protein